MKRGRYQHFMALLVQLRQQAIQQGQLAAIVDDMTAGEV